MSDRGRSPTLLFRVRRRRVPVTEDVNQVRIIDESVRVRLELSSRPGSITLARATLSAVGDAGGFSQELTDDLKTAVSEACNNVVLHAYPDEQGPLTLMLAASPGAVSVTVQDHGQGIREVTVSEQRMGVGLAVISALADRVELTSSSEGTAVRMSFNRRRGRGGANDHGSGSGYPLANGEGTPWTADSASGSEAASLADSASRGLRAIQPPALPELGLSGDVVAWLSPPSAAAPIFGRLIRAIAATSYFTLDGVGDLHPVAEALDAYVRSSTAGASVGFAIDASPRRLLLTGGPFMPGSAAGAERRALALLVAGLRVTRRDQWDLVEIELVDDSRDRAGDTPKVS